MDLQNPSEKTSESVEFCWWKLNINQEYGKEDTTLLSLSTLAWLEDAHTNKGKVSSYFCESLTCIRLI